MELYVNDTDRDVVLVVPISERSGGATATLVGANPNGTDYNINTIQSVQDEDAGTFTFTVKIPLKFVQNDRVLNLKFTQDYVEDTVTDTYTADIDIKVSTPILPLPVIASLLTVPGFDTQVTPDDIKNIERATRYIIQSNTGQDFGCYREGRRAHGSVNGIVELPGRLEELIDINGNTDLSHIHVTPSKRYLHSTASDHRWPYNTPWETDGNPYPTLITGAVYNPKLDGWESNTTEHFWNDIYFNGVWGWKSVPEDVQEAAKLLVNDYACSESAYRDRYLGVMKSADWEINYRTGAWAMTGNARADQLLRNYIFTGGGGVL